MYYNNYTCNMHMLTHTIAHPRFPNLTNLETSSKSAQYEWGGIYANCIH